MTEETRTVHDPFIGEDVQISNRLVDRLRGNYASGPHLPNGNPEFGWRQFQATPINLEAADRIEVLEKALREIADGKGECSMCGKIAVGGGSGCIQCDCERGSWQPRDPKIVARKALGGNL